MTRTLAQNSTAPLWRRMLAPGEVQPPAETHRSRRDWLVDGALFLFAIMLGGIALADTWSQQSASVRVIDIVIGAAACTSLWFRRRRPYLVAVFAVLASGFLALPGGAALIALFNAAMRLRGTQFAVVCGFAAFAAVSYSFIYEWKSGFWAALALCLLVSAVAIGWGLFARARRELISSLRERAEIAEAEQLLREEHARDAERRRIAREMHDVLAHRISLLSLHAGALEFRPDASPDEIAEAAAVIRSAAHDALQELRDVVGVLRDGAEQSSPPPPQPTLADISTLVEQFRAAGMNVSWNSDDIPKRSASDVLGRTAYRIVQEGLTNASKHAPYAAVDVSIKSDNRSGMLVKVESRLSVGALHGATDPRSWGNSAVSLHESGVGLIGLTERVELAGGKLEYGPSPRGDYILSATLPLQA